MSVTVLRKAQGQTWVFPWRAKGGGCLLSFYFRQIEISLAYTQSQIKQQRETYKRKWGISDGLKISKEVTAEGSWDTGGRSVLTTELKGV